MDIQVRHDDTIRGSERLNEQVAAVLEDSLERFKDQISRVEVHFADENGPKAGDGDIRCTIDVKFDGRPNTAVTHHASSLDVALEVAADKMGRMLEHQVGRTRDRASAQT
ncbi:MAG: HPF/RaiA family ribosome-associated protein [Deltaproteobacteria bacterium]|nr:HPF/RaiA family ribosome-associated protein [Deltaproteobacteria bacterium]